MASTLIPQEDLWQSSTKSYQMVETQSSEIGGTRDILIMKEGGERMAVF